MNATACATPDAMISGKSVTPTATGEVARSQRATGQVTDLLVCRRPEELKQFVAAWNDIAATPLQSPAWLLSWWEAFGQPDDRLHVLVAKDLEQVVGILPLYNQRRRWLGDKLNLLGSRSACTDFQTLIAPPAYAAAFRAAVQKHLTQSAARGTWNMLELDGYSIHDPGCEGLIASFVADGCQLVTTQLESTWRLELASGWEACLGNMAKTQRKQSRSLLRTFDREPALELELVERPAEVDAALSHLIDLHQRRWQAAGEPGCFADPRFEPFLRLACERLAKRSQCRLALLKRHGTPLAAQLYLLDAQGGHYVYQAGRDPALESQRVGQMLILVALRRLAEMGVPFVDYMRGDEIYKDRLRAVPTACLRTRLFAGTLSGRVHFAGWRTAYAATRFLARLRSPRSQGT